ncbi:MAG TPA: alpha/beta hydrolase domain-containing protein, partial [Longimicrobiales bacterium]|nr:alpha/beta hydrolase domain-containing protein [Longimicrobiales bacterium]
MPRESWRFVPDSAGRLTRVMVEGGFVPGRIYELVYRAANPRVVGLGLAAVRDVMSYARYGLDSPFPARRGIAFGVSQTGRFLRHFLYQGFNVDEEGRTVFDGMLIHSAGAGRGSFNHRFAQPSRDAHPYSSFFYPTDLFPFTSRTLLDPVAGVEDGLLAHTPEGHRPLTFYTNTGYEYWGRAASLIHTGPGGLEDVPPLPNERIYHLAGGQHFVGAFPRASSRPAGDSAAAAPPVLQGNPLDFLPTLRALAVAMVGWVESGAPPPASAYPTLGEGTLVPPGGVAYPGIPGLTTARVAHEAYRADYGPEFRQRGVITRQPPDLGAPFPSLVSQVDGLGNEVAGVRGIELRVPVATYLPWNLRGPGAPAAPEELSDFVGTLVPFPRTDGERNAWGDPRPSLEALYGGRSRYMRRVVAAIRQLTELGFLL